MEPGDMPPLTIDTLKLNLKAFLGYYICKLITTNRKHGCYKLLTCDNHAVSLNGLEKWAKTPSVNTGEATGYSVPTLLNIKTFYKYMSSKVGCFLVSVTTV